jgi:dsDNA-specific endonuclease/ATPase MutS2
MATHKLTNEIIEAAIDGFEAQKQRIDERISELRQLMSGETSTPETIETPGRKRRKMSAAGRKRIAEAQRKRWADSRKESGEAPQPVKAAKKGKRRLSPEGRKRIIEATKKRWAAVRAAAAAKGK